MLTFGDPFYFFLLLPAAAAAWFIYRRRVRAGIIFSAVSRCAQAGATWRVRASQVLPLLFLAGLVLAIVALARPRTVFSKTRRTTDVVAIQMVVDISGSMEALDLSIRTATGMDYRTRLEAVKEAFAEFVARRPDDLIGLVTFGGYASTRAPLTTDHDALVHVLDGIEVPKPYQDGEGVYNVRDVEIVDNVFEVGTAKAVRISGVQTLTSRGNTFKQNGMPVKNASRFTVFSRCVDTMVEH